MISGSFCVGREIFLSEIDSFCEETLVPSLEKLTGPMNVLPLMISQSLTKFLAEGHKAKNQNTQKPNSTSD